MKKIKILISLLVLSAFFATAQTNDWSGTGWALNNGYVVTNWHVAENARSILLKFPDGENWKTYSAEVVTKDETNDIAILRITSSEFTSFGDLQYAVKSESAEVGEDVFVLGYPLTTTMGDEIKLTTGVISSLSGYEGSRVQYQISAPIQSGNSGGPLFDSEGNVIGIVSAKHVGAENVGYAVKAQYLTALANSNGLSNIIPRSNKIKGLRLTEKVRAVKSKVCFIYCSVRPSASKQTNPRYGSPEIPQGAKVIELPYVDESNASGEFRIKSVTITNEATIVDISINNQDKDGYFMEMCIQKGAYIEVNDTHYKLKKVRGIALCPNTTKFSHVGETREFTLTFEAIPKGSTSMSIVEPDEGGWRIYGIDLK